MVRLILVTFAFLGFAFYQMSGGSDFEPVSAQFAEDKANALTAQTTDNADVTRVALNLTSVDDVLEGRAAVPVNLPQQKTLEAEATITQAVQQGESVTLIPSLIAGANPVPEPTPVAAPAPQTTTIGFVETRVVSGNRVNVRGGPGTTFNVVGRLVRGDEVEVLEDTGTGWVRFRSVDNDTQGWIADFLLTGS